MSPNLLVLLFLSQFVCDIEVTYVVALGRKCVYSRISAQSHYKQTGNPNHVVLPKYL